MLSFVGSGKRVVDFGCATGYFAKLLAEQECEVVGVELNSEAAKVANKYCEDVIVADLDREKVEDILGSQKFDVATFGDILEHLKDPWSLLKSIKDILNPDGFIVASIPNIAHGSVRLALLEGKFEYQDMGLLDNTHLRFFTHSSVIQLFKDTGYCVQAEESVQCAVFNNTPYTPNIDKGEISAELVNKVLRDKNSDILQFIVRAYPYSKDVDHFELQVEHEKLQVEYGELEIEYEELKMHTHRLEKELHRTQQDLWHSQSVIESMTNSKFWKARQAYSRIISRFGQKNTTHKSESF